MKESIDRYLSLFPETNKKLLKVAGVLLVVACITEVVIVYDTHPLSWSFLPGLNPVANAVEALAIAAMAIGAFSDRRLLLNGGFLVYLLALAYDWLSIGSGLALRYAFIDLVAFAVPLVLLLVPRADSSKVLPALATLFAVAQIIRHVSYYAALLRDPMELILPIGAAFSIASVVGLQIGIACIAWAVSTGTSGKKTSAEAAAADER